MGRYTFNLPDIGEGITEAEVVAWHVKVGDMVAEDGQLADLMTDKATVEMESPVAGKVLEVGGEVGDVLAIGSALVVLEVEGEGNTAATPAAKPAAKPAAAVSAPTPEPEPEPEPIPEPEAAARSIPEPQPAKPAPPPPPAPSRPPAAKNMSGAKVQASPAVRARAKEMGIDLADIRPQTGERVRHADLDAFISYGSSAGYAPAGAARADQQIKVVGLRRRIAENMAAAKRAIPHFTYVEECDVTDLEKLRADLNEGRGDRPKLTLLPLLIAAICRSIPQFPMINARYDDEANIITHHGAVHLGMATMTPGGLMVPVIRDAQSRNLWQLAAEILRLSEAARTGKAKSEELSGSTFTITSLGPLGGVASTPVINKPEVAILAPNRIVERPAFVSDDMGGERVAKRKLMNLSISCDHRVVDGYDAAAFVQEIKKLLESPARILAG